MAIEAEQTRGRQLQQLSGPPDSGISVRFFRTEFVQLLTTSRNLLYASEILPYVT